MEGQDFTWSHKVAQTFAAMLLTIFGSLFRQRSLLDVLIGSLVLAIAVHTEPVMFPVLNYRFCKLLQSTKPVCCTGVPLIDNENAASGDEEKPKPHVQPYAPMSARQTGLLSVVHTNPLRRAWLTLAVAATLWTSRFYPSTPLECATERNSPDARRIRLHCENSIIYRFTPRSIIKVSIDWSSFKKLGSSSGLFDAQRDFLQSGLRTTLCTINNFHLGITFQFVDEEQGFIELKYGGNKGSQAWAMTEFPDPDQERYTIKIYAATFEAQYGPAILGILSHEFAHLLGMRHHRPHNGEPTSVRYGDRDPDSIMGDFTHPAELRFHSKDVWWLRMFYKEVSGGIICSKTIVNVPVPI